LTVSKFGGITEAFHTPDQPGRILWVQTKGVFQSKVYNQITRGMYSRGIKGMVARAARKSNISIPGFHLFHPLRNDERDIFSMILTDTRGKKSGNMANLTTIDIIAVIKGRILLVLLM